FNVVSKSGGTGETTAQFLVIVDLLQRRLGDRWRDNLVITTDPERGFLREFSAREAVQSFSIDPGVGGRFSILTPVGLLPAAMTGIDIRMLCRGAGALKRPCFAERLEDNPAAMLAALLYLSQQSLNRPIQVVFAYSNRLYPVADWFRQLWAESLGKRYSKRGDEIFTGPTPVKAVGATDQHSQVQLYVEGPADKVFLFLGTREFRRSVPIPGLGMSEDTVEYLQGAELGELLNAERRATAYALTRAGRPNMIIEHDRIDPMHIGGLMYLIEAATLYAGGFYDVNPLDQPGVEAGKLATYALMGRPGYEREREEIDKSSALGGKVMTVDIR
ncbi:MAG TPA: glucose-6-phosphate isomerase, partial [Bacteroidetes bacterium]|nr:glucose-6-phosphate isomerase [Bacteroidota bacterium]